MSGRGSAFLGSGGEALAPAFGGGGRCLDVGDWPGLGGADFLAALLSGFGGGAAALSESTGESLETDFLGGGGEGLAAGGLDFWGSDDISVDNGLRGGGGDGLTAGDLGFGGCPAAAEGEGPLG